MDRQTLARCLASLLCSLVSSAPLIARAQRSSCETYDVDGNGRVEAADAATRIEACALLAGCEGVDLSEAFECRSFDANHDGDVSTLDHGALHAELGRFLACLQPAFAFEGGCAGLDADGNGRVTVLDFPASEARYRAFLACIPVDLAVLDCADLDYDGDTRISTVDRNLLTERAEAFGHCLGSSLAGADGLFVSRSRLVLLSTTGRAWRTLLAEAELPDLAADLIELSRRDPALDRRFRARLLSLREARFQGRTLVGTHEDRPNNWGTHAGATRIAIALHLGDEAELAAAAAVHRGWLGEREACADFRYGALSWQADETRPVGINRVGARRSGIDLDGAQPEEMRRGGPRADPPARTGYAWEALQGATVATELLARNGYPHAWRWGDSALLRAVDYLARLDTRYGGWWAHGDDRWNVWLVNHGTARAYPTEAGVGPGKNLGFTDWTHAPRD